MLMYPNRTGEIRNDAGGLGFYGAPRKKIVDGKLVRYKHKGVDYSMRPGEHVYMPLTGIISRHAPPYASGDYSGIEIIARRGVFKMFYLDLLPEFYGNMVIQGTPIGVAQDISKRYGAVTPHVHFEIVSLDPEVLMD